MTPSRRQAGAALLLGAFVVAGLLVSPGALVDRLRSLVFGPWFPVVLVGLYLLRPAFAWPIVALSALVGYRYGLVVGVPLALAGAVATSLLPYAAGRRLRHRRGLVGRFAGGSTRFFGTAGDFRGVLAARLAPTPAEAVSVAAGLAEVRVGAFVLGTAVGELPWTVAAVFAGASMERFAAAGFEVDWRLVAACTLLGLALLVGPAYRYATGARRVSELLG